MGTDQTPPNTTRADEAKKWIAVAVAALVLLVYFCLVYRAWNASGNAAEIWARKIYLLGGIESLAFAAAGWFFGREVNRQTVESLKNQAETANGATAAAQGNEKQALEALDHARSAATALAASLVVSAGDEATRLMRDEKGASLQEMVGRAKNVLDEYSPGFAVPRNVDDKPAST